MIKKKQRLAAKKKWQSYFCCCYFFWFTFFTCLFSKCAISLARTPQPLVHMFVCMLAIYKHIYKPTYIYVCVYI